MRGNKNKSSKISKSMLIIYIGMIASLNLIGVGYASWESGLSIISTISTGHIDPVFYGIAEVDQGESDEDTNTVKPMVDVTIGNKDEGEYKTDKKMNVLINNVCSGYSTNIKYTVKNNGTIPVVCEMEPISEGPITVNEIEPIGRIEPGEQKQGEIKITLGNIEPASDETGGENNPELNFNLSFKQYNAI